MVTTIAEKWEYQLFESLRCWTTGPIPVLGALLGPLAPSSSLTVDPLVQSGQSPDVVVLPVSLLLRKHLCAGRGNALSTALQSMASIFCLLIVSSCKCSLTLKLRRDLHAPVTIRKSMLYFFLFFGFTTLKRFLPTGLTSDLLYITRVTDVFSMSSSPISPYRFFTVLSAIMFTVVPLPSWNFSYFPLTSRVANTRLGLPAEATVLSCSSTAITATYSSSSDSHSLDKTFFFDYWQQTAI